MNNLKHKYSYTSGVAFYSEKEMLRLQKWRRNGWQFVKMNRLGFLVFQPSEPAEKLFAVDFFSGKPVELNEYLEFYEASGWKVISNYRGKYFYFMAEPGTPLLFSDQTSYQERIFAEWRWLLRQSIWIPLVGLAMLIGNIFLKQAITPFLSADLADFIVGFVIGVGSILLITPILYLLTILFMQIRYGNRADFYQHPEKLAQKQRIGRDMLFLMGIGGVIGLILGFVIASF